MRQALEISAVKKRKFTVTVASPTGSKTLIQRKVGKKWKTEIRRSSRASQTFTVKRLGTYRVVIVTPTKRVTSKSFKVAPAIRETLSTKALSNQRIVVKVTAPSGSTTLIQRKVGKKWKTEIKRSSRASQTFKVKKLGTYRVVIVTPTERATSKSFKALR